LYLPRPGCGSVKDLSLRSMTVALSVVIPSGRLCEKLSRNPSTLLRANG
jgi:hypothetical protein